MIGKKHQETFIELCDSPWNLCGYLCNALFHRGKMRRHREPRSRMGIIEDIHLNLISGNQNHFALVIVEKENLERER